MREPRLNSPLKLAFLLLLAPLLLAGCGGSSDSTASSPVTKAAFIKKADLICNKADAAQPVAREAFLAKHEKKLEKLAAVPYEEIMARDLILPSVKKQLKEIESLELPDGEEKKVKAIIAGWRTAVRKGEKDPYSIADFWNPAQDPLAKINKIATRYGFKDCAELR